MRIKLDVTEVHQKRKDFDLRLTTVVRIIQASPNRDRGAFYAAFTAEEFELNVIEPLAGIAARYILLKESEQGEVASD